MGRNLGSKINSVAPPDDCVPYAASRGTNNPVDRTKKVPEFDKLFIADTQRWRIEE